MPELVEVVALAHFTDTRVGGVSRKQILRVPKPLAEHFVACGLVKLRNPIVTVAKEAPSTEPLVDGGGELSALSPADLVSQTKTAKSSKKQKPQQL